MKPNFDQAVPATLAFLSLAALVFSHWLQIPDPATTALVGTLAGATTLYFVNRSKPTP